MRVLTLLLSIALAGAVLLPRDGAGAAGADVVKPANRAFPGLNQKRWSGPFFFIQMADTQFGMFNKDVSWEEETKLVGKAVEHINRLKPKFVIVCGDLVNQGPEGKAHAAEVAEFKRLMAEVSPGIPVVSLPGNHDVGNKPTPESLAAYRRDFGDDWFGFWAGGVRCLVTNSSLYSDPTGAPDQQDQQNAWLTQELRAAKDAKPVHILHFQHHPWFLENADEKDQYFNIPMVRRAPALQLFHQAGVRALFAGHYHRNAHGWDGDLEMITTSAVGKPLGKDPSGFRIVKVYKDRIEHKFYGLDEVPTEVKLD